jgi:hypothetical protein
MSLRHTALLALAALVVLPLTATTALAAPDGCDQICFVGPTCCCGGTTYCPGEGGSCGGCVGGPGVEEPEDNAARDRFLEALALGGGGCENTCDMGVACCCEGQFVACAESCDGACGEGETLEAGFDLTAAASCANAAR